ncbi:MAG TPA: hypothetical protein VK572_05580 [Burkholderiales bacterium]|nr:hypothetical protein [Burkholderiales bacterium]
MGGAGAMGGNTSGGGVTGWSARFGSGGGAFAGRADRGALGAIRSSADCRSNTMNVSVAVTSTVAVIATGVPQRRANPVPADFRLAPATRCDAARTLSSTRCEGLRASASR